MNTHKFCWLLAWLWLWSGLAAQAQASKAAAFKANIVKLAGFKGSTGAEPRYGFVTGAGKAEVYFVLISKDKAFLDEHSSLSVFLGTGKRKSSVQVSVPAEQLAPSTLVGAGSYYLALYRVAGNFPITRQSFLGVRTAEEEGYRLFWDQESSTTGFTPYINDFAWSRLRLVESQRPQLLVKQPIKFIFTIPTQTIYASAGMPVLDKQGNVVGLVAENQDQKTSTHQIDVLNIATIKHKLNSLGSTAAGGPCAYFNLIEYGKDETECDQKQHEEEARQKSAADYENYLAGLQRKERRVIRHDRNYPLAVSATVSGHLAALSFETGSDNKGTQSGNSYSYGLNLDFGPDSSLARLSLRPRFAAYTFDPPSTYTYTSTSGFALKHVRVKTIELPVVLEFVTSRKLTHTNYFGLGYVYGWQRAADFAFTTTGQAERTETLLDNPQSIHKLLLELGYESGKHRLAVSYTYQFSQFLRRDYQFILGGETITPLRDAGKGYWTLGLEYSYRLWGRWQNGRIYKK